jgi:peptide-methionine (R)-S-oxide reductase
MIKEKDWKKKLTATQYYVLREKGTELPFTGKFLYHTDKGIYCCAGCDAELFSSDTKYDSHCGWPAFYDAHKDKILLQKDTSNGMIRMEVLCKNCGGHLGHLFDDGPKPTGLRYCINSVSLSFKKKKENKI